MTLPTNSTAVETLEPTSVWRFFALLAAVPRPSKREEKIRARVRALAQELGFPAREDATGNIVLTVPASPGCDNAPITVLQGHVDMVCEKNAGTVHDFDQDPIRLVLDKHPQTGDAIVRADGTTLGADNGVGLALALAAATSPEVVHGPLEILCTIDEEMGMTGAKALASDFVHGRRMINLDSEEDDALYIGCAGGCDTTLTWDFKAAPPPQRTQAFRVSVGGLRGGHSGCDIHLNRASAVKLLVRTLVAGGEGHLRLAELRGGSKRNVIPREASALVLAPAKAAAKLSAAGQQILAEAVSAGETGCSIKVEPADTPVPPAASAADTARLLAALVALPHGVLAVVPEIAGLVQTSNSTSTLESALVDGKLRVVVGCLSRSSSMPQLDATARQLAAIGQLAGALVERGNGYPGWQPNVKSELLVTCRRLYEQLFGATPRVAAIHAGLECGIIGERMGEPMDMISFGPHIEGAHSPDEKVWVASVQKTWKYLQAVLAELAKG